MDRSGRHARFLSLAMLLAVGACAAPVTHFGGAWTAGIDQAFTMAPGDHDDATAAVRTALVAAGYRQADDAPYRVEVGFAIRPRKLAVTAQGQAKAVSIISPQAKASFSFCKRQAYALSVAMIDRKTGAVLNRTGATTSRCRGAPAAVLPLLAQAAVSRRP